MVKFLASCQVTDTSTKLENRFSSQTIGCKEGGKKFQLDNEEQMINF